MEQLDKQLDIIIDEFIANLDLKRVEAVVLGCSSSTIINEKIGKATNKEIGELVVKKLMNELSKISIQLVVQGCQHINRSLVVERKYALKYNLEEVNVRPVLTAGGAVATAAFDLFEDPVMVRSVKVEAGIDIGQTFIGMHLKEVAIPIHLENNVLGSANVVGVKSRPRLVGGIRAVYQEDLL